MKRAVYVLVALASGWASAAASQGHGAAAAGLSPAGTAESFTGARADSAAAWTGSTAVLPQALRPAPPSSAHALPPERSLPIRLGRYTYWGMGIGGAAGLAYGLVEGDDTFGLSPVIEMAIGAGIGFYVGAAVDIVRSLGSPPGRR